MNEQNDKELKTEITDPKTTGEQKPDSEAASQQIAAKKVAKKTKGKKKHVTKGRAYILATYNNTLITFTDNHGNVLSQASAGRCGFKGPKKSTPFAAAIIVKKAAEKVREFGLKEVEVIVKGIGGGREGAIRAINSNGFNMLSIKDRTPIPHNGCRPAKVRRV